MAGKGTLTVRVIGDTRPLEKSLGSGGALGKVAAFGAAAAAAGGLAAAAFGVKAVNAAAELSETLSKTTQVFGDASGEVIEFANHMSDAFGLPKQQILDAASNIGLVAKASGLAAEDAAFLSTEMAHLAADASSFFNVPLDEALEKIRAGLVGEAEPLRAFGVLLSAAAVEEKALALGIAKVGEELTEQQKVQARSAIIFEQMSDATGDLERTQFSLSNQVRALKGDFTNFTAEAGAVLLPFLENLAPEFREELGEMQDVIIAKLKGAVKAFQDSGVGGLLKWLTDQLGSSLQNDVIPFFTQTVIPELFGRGIKMIVALADGIRDHLPEIVGAASDALVEFVTFMATDGLPTLIDTGITLLVALADGIIGALDQLVDRLPAILDAITTFFEGDSLGQLIDAALAIVVSLAEFISDNAEEIGSAAGVLISTLVEFVLDPALLGQLVAAGVKVAVALAAGIAKAAPQVATAFLDALPLLPNFSGPDLAGAVAAASGGTMSIDAHGNIVSTVPYTPVPTGPPRRDNRFAHGGVVPGPVGAGRMALVHGGETIIPAGRVLGGDGAVSITVNGFVGNERELADQIAEMLRRRERGLR